MEEDPVYYFTFNETKGNEWKSAKHWPLPEEKRIQYYLGYHSLSLNEPAGPIGKDNTKMTSGFIQDTVGNKVIILETATLEKDVQVTGHPAIDLWTSSTAKDGNFFATIQDVAPDGTISSYTIQGQEPQYGN